MKLDTAIADVRGIPLFNPIRLTDRNPLSGRVKKRVVYDPNPAMRAIHAALIHDLRYLECSLSFEIATGSRPGSSPRKNVEPHRSSRFFYLTDIKGAYPSVDIEKLAHILCVVYPAFTGRLSWILQFLLEYCAPPKRKGLAIGAPASPDLFNVYAAYLCDKPLGHFCRREGITVTRYLDDLTFSSQERIGNRTRRVIRDVVTNSGLLINHRKSEVHDLKLDGPITINGVGLEYGGRTFLPVNYLKRVQELIVRALSGEEDVSFNRVAGMMSLFYAMTDLKSMNEAEREVHQQFLALRRVQALKRR